MLRCTVEISTGVLLEIYTHTLPPGVQFAVLLVRYRESYGHDTQTHSHIHSHIANSMTKLFIYWKTKFAELRKVLQHIRETPHCASACIISITYIPLHYYTRSVGRLIVVRVRLVLWLDYMSVNIWCKYSGQRQTTCT